MVKERIVAPDVLVNLKAIKGLDQVASEGGGAHIGGLITLDALSRHPLIRRKYACWPKRPKASRRRRSAMSARWPATSASAPGAGISATVSRASRRAAISASRSPARTSFTPSSAAGPASSCIPSDTAPALVALDAKFRVDWARRASAPLPAADFFVLPKQNAARENVAGERRSAGSDRSCRRLVPGRGAPITRCSIARRGPTPW